MPSKRCLVSVFIIKPQRTSAAAPITVRCLVSVFIIKPQLNDAKSLNLRVV